MNTGQTVFSQLIDFLPKKQFDQCVRRYHGNHRIKSFSCFDQYLCMVFAQITYRQSLRDIETCLLAMKQKLYHCGIRANVCRSTLAEANENRDWRIYADFAQILIDKARTLYANEDFGVQLDREVYALDSSTIDLCLSLFPWAKFRQYKAAVKIHTLMHLKGSIPTFIRITDGKVHDVNILDDLVLEPGAIYVMDRGYLDFARLFTFTQTLSTFVTRAKTNFDYRRLSYREVDKATGLRCDQTIRLNGFYTSQEYPAVLRRIGYCDIDSNKKFIFLTNNFSLNALTIAQLYKCRWRIEIFFKWIKQYLRIKTFFGTSENAVKTQIWIAISVYVLAAIVKKELKLELSLGEILQILSIVLFEKVLITQALMKNDWQNENAQFHNQLLLFDL
ncbi:MAG TPA: IS4 family transposase [Candidatus Paceibacterota bacterium]|nr:IS4 family transposase [Candidatus Paceibacterota bacterium]